MRATSMHSVRAHSAIATDKDRQHQLILAELRAKQAPMTRKELAVAIKADPGTSAARCNELIKAEYLVEVGTKRCPVSGMKVGALALSICEGA